MENKLAVDFSNAMTLPKASNVDVNLWTMRDQFMWNYSNGQTVWHGDECICEISFCTKSVSKLQDIETCKNRNCFEDKKRNFRPAWRCLLTDFPVTGWMLSAGILTNMPAADPKHKQLYYTVFLLHTKMTTTDWRDVVNTGNIKYNM